MSNYNHPNGATTLPRDFRFHHEEPKTPEASDTEPRQPSPPRQRLRIRKRQTSSLYAPTEQFLASVAAADMPIPTIEFPQSQEEDFNMTDMNEFYFETSGLLAPNHVDFRAISPPKTPMPSSLSIDVGVHRPDWSMSTPTPDEEHFRPSSALSSSSDFSEESFYSGGQFSRRSEDGSCESPDSEIDDPFQFPAQAKGKSTLEEPFTRTTAAIGKRRSKLRKDAPWTKAQSNHVWRTYMIYLNDATVTPFRIGASQIPPEGVCNRVARESRRSWRGPRHILGHSSSAQQVFGKARSATPTLEMPKVYGQWTHTDAATRNHLRILCKTKNDDTVTQYRHLQSRSPTPFTRPIARGLRTQEPSFSVKDMSMILTTSTAESMRPDGPLAQLAQSEPVIVEESPVLKSVFPPLDEFGPLNFGRPRCEDNVFDTPTRLASPFMAQTYGPSSSNSMNPYLLPAAQLSSDVGTYLRSSCNQSRSLCSTQKRRAQNELDEEMSPHGAIIRPSILNEQLFGTPLNARRVRSRGFSLGDEAFRRAPGIFQNTRSSEYASMNQSIPTTSVSAPMLLPPPRFDPPRLGSPFVEAQTFPRRIFPDDTATIRRSHFATMHQSRRSIESFDFGKGQSLQSRLQTIESKLNQIQEREPNHPPR